MKKTKHSEEKIIAAVKQMEGGRSVKELARELGVTDQTLYNWKSKYTGMEVSDAKRLRALEDENRALKERLETGKHLADLSSELNETRKKESDVLRSTVAAKNETIAAKDAVIASQDKLIEALKKNKSSPWRRIGDVLIGAAVFALLK